eukprot:2989968-Ditylum_brightwellii.AAC.1
MESINWDAFWIARKHQLYPGKPKTEEENRPIGQLKIQYVEGVPGGTWKGKEIWCRRSNNPKTG